MRQQAKSRPDRLKFSMDQLDRLSTIEHALSRKRAALRSLSLRVHSRAAPAGKPVPSSDAARLAILQREVDSLERSREEALLTLASSSKRHARTQQVDTHADENDRRTANDDVPETAQQRSGERKPEMRPAAEPARASTTTARGDDAQWAWKVYRTAQRQRDAALRDSLKKSWKVHGGELATMRQEATPRVDSGDAALPPGPVKAEHAPADAMVHAARRDGKHLNRELRVQRQAEWAARGDFLRDLREQTGKRIDDHVGPEVLRARPLYGFTASAATAAPSFMRYVLSNEGLEHAEAASAAPYPPRSMPPPHGGWQVDRDDEGEYEVGFAGTVYTDKLYAYGDGDDVVAFRAPPPHHHAASGYRLGPAEDPMRFAYTAGSPTRAAGAAKVDTGRHSSGGRPKTYDAMRKMLRDSPRH